MYVCNYIYIYTPSDDQAWQLQITHLQLTRDLPPGLRWQRWQRFWKRLAPVEVDRSCLYTHSQGVYRYLLGIYKGFIGNYPPVSSNMAAEDALFSSVMNSY